MTLATGTPELDLRKTVLHLYVEQRELTPPVTLDYPTYEAAAAACGQSRIWGGVHWPVDNERGLQLGRSVGENAWDRAQQFLLGAASPATAAMASLHPPFWFHQGGDSSQGTKFSDRAGLVIDLAPGAAGIWRSIVLDPLPVGAYELKLKAGVTIDAPVHLRVAIEATDTPGAEPLAASESVVSPTVPNEIVTLPWTSDGVQPFAVSVKAGPNTTSAGVLISAIHIARVWPITPGSPRFVEPSLAGQPEE
jgi:hypothetical protein